MEAIVVNKQNYQIYVLCYNNLIREEQMVKRLNETATKAIICSFKENIVQHNDRNISCFFNHLAMMKEFLRSNKDFGVFIENDVHLKKNLNKGLIDACAIMTLLNLDVLLIGYLINKKPEAFGCKQIHNDKLGNTYYNYGAELWGTQGFILTRKQAQYYVDKYTVEYVQQCSETISADWIYTKQGNRALMYPPLVVEEGTIAEKEHQGQINFHKTCKEFLYNSSYTF